MSSVFDLYSFLFLVHFCSFYLVDRAFQEIIHDITSGENRIKEGTSEFTRRFMDIARAGTKMITEDQTLYNLEYTNRRSELQGKASVNLLKQIAAHNISSSSSFGPKSPSSLSASQQEPPSSSHYSSSSLIEDITLENVEETLLLSKNITYQSSENEKLHASTSSKGKEKKMIREHDAFDVESELSSEVIVAIEKREAILLKLEKFIKELERVYLTEGYDTATQEGKELLEGIFDELRHATLEFSEAYGAWSRVYMKVNTGKLKSQLKAWEKDKKSTTVTACF
jgi:hypothetical protein